MFNPKYLAPPVKVTELIRMLNVVISAIFVITFPGYSIIFPPTESSTQIGSSFCGLMSTTMCDYLTVRTTGIILRAKKLIVLLIFPSVSSSIFLYFIFPKVSFFVACIKCFYCNTSSVSGPITQFMRYQCKG